MHPKQTQEHSGSCPRGVDCMTPSWATYPSSSRPSWAVGDRAPGSHRKKAERGKLYFTNLQSKDNVPTMINPKPCGHLCCCVVRGCEQV